MDTELLVYVQAPSGTTHLVKEARFPGLVSRTLCGRRVEPFWEYGDETPSGIAADCDVCKGRKDR